ncbi:MAG TPA: hypothetical protein VGE58_06955 [Daejeonella sp.]
MVCYLCVTHDTLTNRGQAYEASQVKIQLISAEAWILFKQGKIEQRLINISTQKASDRPEISKAIAALN